MAKLELVVAILVTLFAIGFEAQADHFDLFDMCQRLHVRLLWPGNGNPASTEQLMSRAKSHIGMRNHFMADRFMKAWTTVVEASDCENSSLEIVQTIAECSPGSAFGILNDATKEYAQKCLNAKYIRDQIEANKIKSTLSDFLDHEFFAALLENSKNRPMELANSDEFAEAVAKAIIRHSKESAVDLENKSDVDDYLEERLLKPCSAYLKASKEIMEKVISSSVYLGGYDKLLSLLEGDDYKTTQEDIHRYRFCDTIRLSCTDSTEIRYFQPKVSLKKEWYFLTKVWRHLNKDRES